MTRHTVRCELHWERPEAELDLHVDIAFARMILAIPVRRRWSALKRDVLGERWEFLRHEPGERFRPEPGLPPKLLVDCAIDDAEFDCIVESLDFDDAAGQEGDFWPDDESLRRLVADDRFAARLERFLRRVISDRQKAAYFAPS